MACATAGEYACTDYELLLLLLLLLLHTSTLNSTYSVPSHSVCLCWHSYRSLCCSYSLKGRGSSVRIFPSYALTLPKWTSGTRNCSKPHRYALPGRMRLYGPGPGTKQRRIFTQSATLSCNVVTGNVKAWNVASWLPMTRCRGMFS